MAETLSKTLAYAAKHADHAQANLLHTKEDKLRIVAGRIKDVHSSISTSCYIDVYVGKRKGSFQSNALSTHGVDQALQQAKASRPLQHFFGLPGKRKAPYVKSYAAKTGKLATDELIAYAKELCDLAKSKSTLVSEGMVVRRTRSLSFANTQGCAGSYRKTLFDTYVSVVAKQGTKQVSYADQRSGITMPAADYAQAAKAKALFYLKPQRVAALPKTVILAPPVFSELLSQAFLPGLSSEQVLSNRSRFKGKIGQRILSDITIIDDATLPYGVASQPFDYEGTPSRRTVLLSNGVLKGFINDHTDALRMRVPATGNATDGGADFSNVLIKGKHAPVDEALVIESVIGAHTANATTTDFSVAVEHAYVRQGDKRIPVEGLMIAGNMHKALAEYMSIGKAVQQNEGIITGALATSALSVTRS